MNVIDPSKNRTLPDPFRSGSENYDDVYKILDEATDALVKMAKNKRTD